MYKIRNYKAATGAEVLIYGEIGEADFGVDAGDFYQEVAALDAPEITFRINSYGGDVFAGAAIYNFIRRLPALTTTTVDGVAASIASVIAMAGDQVTMSQNSMLMIHNAWTAVQIAGDANTFEESAEEVERMKDTLRAIDTTIVEAYSQRANVGQDQLRAWMDQETWFTASDAVTLGFADSVVDALPAVAACYVPAGRFKNTPNHLLEQPAPAPGPQAAPIRSQSRARLELSRRPRA